MNPQSVTFVKRLLLALIVSLGSIVLLREMLVLGMAQTTEEREVEDKIPKHVPLKVKIRSEKEKAFKDLKNEKWHRDLEIEVTNTSGRPVYFLELWVVLPDVISENGMEVGFPLRHGRMDFVYFKTLAVPGDIPIGLGEIYIFKIPDKYQRGWEWRKARGNRPDPKRIQIKFVQLSFGDGTGFNGTHAKPYPYTRNLASPLASAKRTKI